ncbi:hypothetical protein BDN71DRAFT_373456 [Pleurotus eryngii]|uniref:Uncharacterized protein n=1 Tax=Pleurotus eryngii TaxID=5323 RepID=A0A9P6A544_PLEER|nr:hypothetical protein BDN71DRAFT_373456 [Pleurotus eryngii]
MAYGVRGIFLISLVTKLVDAKMYGLEGIMGYEGYGLGELRMYAGFPAIVRLRRAEY